MDTSLKSKSQSDLSKRYYQIYNMPSRLLLLKINFRAGWIALATVVVLVIVIIAGVCALLYVYRKGIMCKRNLNKLDSIESQACGDTTEQQQLSMISPLAHNQPPASTQTFIQSRESTTTPQVNGTLLHHDHPMPNFSRHPDRNSVTDIEDHALLDITTPDSSFEDKWYAGMY